MVLCFRIVYKSVWPLSFGPDASFPVPLDAFGSRPKSMPGQYSWSLNFDVDPLSFGSIISFVANHTMSVKNKPTTIKTPVIMAKAFSDSIFGFQFVSKNREAYRYSNLLPSSLALCLQPFDCPPLSLIRAHDTYGSSLWVCGSGTIRTCTTDVWTYAAMYSRDRTVCCLSHRASTNCATLPFIGGLKSRVFLGFQGHTRTPYGTANFLSTTFRTC